MDKIPKFRKVGRVAWWMEKNEYSERIPQAEALFLNSKEDSVEILCALIDYNFYVSEFPPALEVLLYEKAKEVIPPASENVEYLSNFFNYCRDIVDDERRNKYLDLFKGKSNILVRWARCRNERLPTHLEDSLSEPDELLEYATDVLKGRVPVHLENIFHKDIEVATRYAFEVFRNFAPVRLPEHLHNAVLMESFKCPDNIYIKNYVKASKNDPNKTGNFHWYG